MIEVAKTNEYGLNDREFAFANFYRRQRKKNATQAAIKAGYSKKTAHATASRLLKNVKVRKYLGMQAEKIEEETNITVEQIVREYKAIVDADPNELVQLRKCNCRYCWGKEYKYQRTQHEMDMAQRTFLASKETLDGFNAEGGIGWNKMRKPNPDCPECFGEGEMVPVFNDTTELSPQGKALYGGIKLTRHGIEVIMMSKERALEALGKHLGMFLDRKEITGVNGDPFVIKWADIEKRGEEDA